MFLDETGITTNLLRRYGRAPRGARVHDHAPCGRWQTSTFLAALRVTGLTAPGVFDGAIDGESFRAYIEQILVPTLQPGDIVIADNLGAHKVAGIQRAIQAAGATLWYLPPYSPDLHPIELCFAKLKALVRTARCRSTETLWPFLGECLAHFSPDECRNYFRHCGYSAATRRRHIPATLARIPCQRSMDILVEMMGDRDGFLSFKVLAAMEKLRRTHPSLTFDRETVEKRVLREIRKYYNRLGLHYNLFVRAKMPTDVVLAPALEEKTRRTVDRIYRLLGLPYPWKDIAATRWAVEHGDRRARAGALEYLDNILASQIRHRLMPVLEDIPLEEKVRRGNVILKTRPRDVEETMLELINDDDQAVAAAAIDLVGEKEMWNLTDDVEHVLAHRDPKDWYVFEAASWTLASRTLTPERRRRRWIEPLPAAALVGRMRGLKLFGLVSVDELFRMASAGHQVRHDAGTTLLREGAVPENLHLLLDGRVVATARRSGRPRDRPARSPRLRGGARRLSDGGNGQDQGAGGLAGAYL